MRISSARMITDSCTFLCAALNPSKAEVSDKNSKLVESVEKTTDSSLYTIRISSKAFFATCNQSKNSPDESNAMP